jgi:hypothetical protein
LANNFESLDRNLSFSEGNWQSFLTKTFEKAYHIKF